MQPGKKKCKVGGGTGAGEGNVMVWSRERPPMLCLCVPWSPLAVWRGSLWGSEWSRRKPHSGKDCHSNAGREEPIHLITGSGRANRLSYSSLKSRVTVPRVNKINILSPSVRLFKTKQLKKRAVAKSVTGKKWILTGPIIVACQWNTETKKTQTLFRKRREHDAPSVCVNNAASRERVYFG